MEVDIIFNFLVAISATGEGEKSFKFTNNETINCTFDPIKKTITFENFSVYQFLKYESNEIYKMKYVPTEQELHPCVILRNLDD